jgi:sarcosine oxidase subunit gamma
MPAALSFGDVERELALKDQLAICDVSALNRFGIRGPKAADWLGDNGIEAPGAINSWSSLSEKGGLVICLGTSEFLVEDGLESTVAADLQGSLNSREAGSSPVLRQDASFILSGSRALEVMLQTCGLDFGAIDYEERPVFLTRVATISALVLPERDGRIYTFRIWCANPYGLYLWEELNKIVEEFEGDVIGISACLDGGK